MEINNPFDLAQQKQANFTAELAECGYTTISTFYADLSIAEIFGKDSIEDTFKRINSEWLPNYKMYTEFIMALNYKIWEYANEDVALAKYYENLWHKAEDIYEKEYVDNDEAMSYYYSTTD